MNALLIAGTDIGVGKTVLATAIAAYWQRHCASRQLGILQPLSHRDEAHGYEAHKYEEVQLDQVWQQFETLMQTHEFVLVESSGGLGSPVSYETTVADLAWDWRIPAVLVVPVQPGAIAQAVANVALAQQARVHLKGIVLNCVQSCQAQELEDWAAIDLLQSLTRKPVLGRIPYLKDPTDLSKLTQAASNLDLERIMPGI